MFLCNLQKVFYRHIITSYAFDFAPPMKSLTILNSIGNNQNNVWDKGVYLPIEDTRSYGIASNA